ncbi:MAG: L,D-transpeptidase/peptidoglycan binding protein [Ruminococcus sp.]|nr:L,D-transpeptidase/peptidoglycan binding protein [Ruminococcus sp.]
MATKTATKRQKKTKRKPYIIPLILTICILVLIIAFLITALVVGNSKYKNKFIPNTFINDVNVSGQSLSEAVSLFESLDIPSDLVIIKHDGSTVSIPVKNLGFTSDTSDKVKEIYDKVKTEKWYKGIFNEKHFTIKGNSAYDSKKLESTLKSTDFGKEKNKNAEIVFQDNKYIIKDAVQGDELDIDKLIKYVSSQLDEGNFNINAVDSGCYIEPKVKSENLKAQFDKLNQMYSMKIEYDFDYTTETFTGEKLMDMVKVDKKGNVTVDKDKVAKYVETLAKKYDTYNTERKFKATLQGNITVPISDDARYGWWIYKDETCDQLLDLIKKGKDAKVEPIYYQDGSFVYTGMKGARTADSDIGNTYIEIDLTNQTLWYYKNGKKLWECGIVSGQTTSAARTTLPGVYKLWDKQTNFRMKSSNSDGERWDTTCSYWNNVSLCGIGLHDSQWRGTAVGGEIYKYNGSHGCINMTLESAKYIYDNVEYDTPVVMYY